MSKIPQATEQLSPCKPQLLSHGPQLESLFTAGKILSDATQIPHAGIKTWYSQITEKGREFQKNIYFCFIDYAKAFDCMDHNKLWKILEEMGIPDHLTASWEIYMQVRKQQLELDMEQQTGCK